ncbi:MAG: LPS export ABC transporter permease LptG [bacterium]
MKIIDKYLIKQFLQTILFGLLVFIAIFIVIDMMEKLDDFIDENVENKIILEYYIVFIPEIIRLIFPVAVLLAGLFTVGKMSTLNELTAFKAAGVSLYRFMAPFIAVALLLSILSVYFGGYIVPEANERKVYIERNYMKKDVVPAGSSIYFQDSPLRIVTISYYDGITNQANRVSIQDFNEKNLTQMVSRMDSYKMKYDSSKKSWHLFDVVKRTFTDTSEKMIRFKEMEIKDMNFTPEEVIKKQRKPEEMTTTELWEYAEEQLKTGNDPTRIQIEYHSRYAYAFASFFVVLFGLPLTANKRKGGLAIEFGLNLLIAFIYLVFMKVTQAFGKNGALDPIFTAWIANFVFLIAAIINIKRVQK